MAARWQILCDFDGTIATSDTVGDLLSAFAEPAWMEVERDYAAGRINSRDCRARQTEMMHVSQSDFDAVIDRVAIDPGFKDFLAETDRLGLPVTIVSDGYDYSIRRVLANNGIAALDIASNALTFIPPNLLSVAFPNMDKDCAIEGGTCKCAVMGRLRNRKSVLIGDGVSDFCTAGAADFVFARDALIDHCEAEGIAHMKFTSFGDITPHLALLKGDGEGLQALAA